MPQRQAAASARVSDRERRRIAGGTNPDPPTGWAAGSASGAAARGRLTLACVQSLVTNACNRCNSLRYSYTICKILQRVSSERGFNLSKLDATDRRILVELDDDPRLPTVVIAQRLGLARATVQSRLDKLAASGLLRANSSRVRPDSLGRGIAASVRAELDQHLIHDAIEALKLIPEVLECFAPAGDDDLLLRVVARTPDDLYRVSEEIRLCPGIVRTSTSLFLREVIPYRMSALLAAPD